MAAEVLDAVSLSVLKGRLEQIADEMDATLFRAAFNPIIAEAHDASHGLYDVVTGATLVQGASGLPIFVGAMSFAVKYVIDLNPQGFVDGDLFLFNDPYEGGTHLNDFKLVKPFFRHGKLFCHLAGVGHWHDVGGNVPGNYNPVATESYQEAFRIPPVKLYDAGAYRADIVAILQANSRLPMSVLGDLNAQVTALELGAKRLHSLLDEAGDATILSALTLLQDCAATLMRAKLAELPDGEFAFIDYLDNDGITPDALPIAVNVTKSGEAITFDFSASAKSCAGPVNISRATAVAAVYVALKHIFPDVPANAGVMVPVTVIIPDDSILNARHPKPVGGYTETILRMIDVIFSALAQAAPGRINAQAYGTINALSIAGHRTDAVRQGAPPEGDGLAHGNAPISTATIPPLEILEAAYPVRFTQWALRPDSGGAGQFRGGLGAIYEIELLEEAAEVFLFGERGRFAPKGVNGGGEGAANVFQYQQNGVWHIPPLVSKMTGIALKRGDRVRLETPGGGGFSGSALRNADAHALDLALGYITPKRAVTARPKS